MAYSDCDPFMLFPDAIRTASLYRYRAAGLEPELVTDSLKVIVKRATQSDQPADYGVRTEARSFHIVPSSLPEDYRNNPELMLDFVIKLQNGRAYTITSVSSGDDFTVYQGQRFLYVLAQPYGRGTL